MKTSRWFVGGLVALALVGVGVLVKAEEPKPAPPAPKKAPARKPSLGTYAERAEVCRFTDEQKAKVADIVAKLKAAQADWKKANEAKLDAAEAEKKAAEKTDDVARIKDAKAKLKLLQDEYKQFSASAKAQVDALMTPEQELLWAGHLLLERMTTRFKEARLTGAQLDKCKEFCTAAAMDYFKAGDSTTKKGEVAEAVALKIKATVLTDEQRTLIEAQEESKGK